MTNEIKPEMVPDAVVAALQPLLDEEDAPMLRYLVAAALSAWPGMSQFHFSDNLGTFPALILPLPTQENGDDR